jgi:hypothetical protein
MNDTLPWLTMEVINKPRRKIMLYLPVLFFAVAAVGGMTLVWMKNQGKELPMYLALGHGLFAATGLVLLIVNVAMDMSMQLMNVALALFVIIALGGFTLFSFYIRKKPLPNVLIAVHGVGAVISFLILIVAVMG